MKRLFLIIAAVGLHLTLWGQWIDSSSINIPMSQRVPASVVYWFDTDMDHPIYETLPSGPGTIDASSLPDGFHTLHCQVLDTANKSFSLSTVSFLRFAPKHIREASALRYWFDHEIENMLIDSTLTGVRTIDASMLRDGIHTIHYQILDSAAKPSFTASEIFYRFAPKTPQIPTSIRIWYDSDIAHADTIEQWTGTLNLDVNALSDGAHTIYGQIIDQNGHALQINAMSFVKLTNTYSAKGSRISQYAYWIDDDVQKAQEIMLPHAVDTLVINELDVPKATINNHSFIFRIEDDIPKMYAKPKLTCRFMDIQNHCVQQSIQYIDYRTSKVVDAKYLHLNEYIGKVQEDSLYWYWFRAFAGDTISVTSNDNSLALTVFSPSADTLCSTEAYPFASNDIVLRTSGVYYVLARKAEIPSSSDNNSTYIYLNYRASTSNTFAVRFLNYDRTLLAEYHLPLRSVPEYLGPIPTRPEDEGYSYDFAGWNPKIEEVSGDMEYIASYTTFPKWYNIRYVNYDGSYITDIDCPYGSMPTLPDYTPQKPSTIKYSYSFKGWTPEIDTVRCNQTYTAIYDSVVNKYQISFINYDYTVLQTYQVEYDSIPRYTGETPIREKNKTYSYTWKGWSPAIVPVTGDATYMAEYDEVINQYTLELDCSYGYVSGSGIYDYESMVMVTIIPLEHYHFVQWSDGNRDNPRWIYITGDSTLHAYLEYDTFSILTQETSHGYAVGGGQYEYGSFATLMAYPDEGYVFDGWDNGSLSNPYIVYVENDMNIMPLFSVNNYDAAKEKTVYMIGRQLHVENVNQPYSVYDIHGLLIYQGTEPVVNLPAQGIYLVIIQTNTTKIIVQ